MVKTATPSIAVAVSPRGAGTSLSVSSKIISINRGPEGSSRIINLQPTFSSRWMAQTKERQPVVNLGNPVQVKRAEFSGEIKPEPLTQIAKEISQAPRNLRRVGTWNAVSAKNQRLAQTRLAVVSGESGQALIEHLTRSSQQKEQAAALLQVEKVLPEVKASTRRSLVKELGKLEQNLNKAQETKAPQVAVQKATELKATPKAVSLEQAKTAVRRAEVLQDLKGFTAEPSVKIAVRVGAKTTQAFQPLVETGLITQQEAREFTRVVASDVEAVVAAGKGDKGGDAARPTKNPFELVRRRQVLLVKDQIALSEGLKGIKKAVGEVAKRDDKGELKAEGIEVAAWLSATNPINPRRNSMIALQAGRPDGELMRAIDEIRGLSKDRAGLIEAKAMRIMSQRATAMYDTAGEIVAQSVAQKILKRYVPNIFRVIHQAVVSAAKAVAKEAAVDIVKPVS